MPEINGEFVKKGVSFSGKLFKIYGWILIVCSLPLMFVIVGFITLPFGIGMVWYGNKISKKAGAIVEGAASGVANLGKTFNGK